VISARERAIYEAALTMGMRGAGRKFNMHPQQVSRIVAHFRRAPPLAVGAKPPGEGWEYCWWGRRLHGEYRGQPCRIVTAGDGSRMGAGGTAAGSWGCTLVVEFADGVRVVCTRTSIRKLHRAPG
jgi:hypothetical protein